MRPRPRWALIGLAWLPAPAAAQTHLVVVTGLAGEPRHRAAFHDWAATLIDGARQAGVTADRITYLGEGGTGRSTKENVERALGDLARSAAPDAVIVIVLFGHGSTVGGEARLNLPGPDLTAQEVAALLDAFPTQQVAVANTASASGDWVAALSGERRAVITATRSGAERNETVFGRFFAEAFATEAADQDKNGHVSLLEAFDHARQEVSRAYEQERQILTEHALLDDNGDGTGSTAPDPAGDGILAAQIYLGPSPGAAAAARTDDPILRSLYATRDSLERVLARHRAQKGQMTAVAYERELERLLLDLSRTNQAIREREGEPST